jgi:hypothetical protein
VKNSLIAIEPTDVEVDDPEAIAEEDALAAAADARPAADAAAGPSAGDGTSRCTCPGQKCSQDRPHAKPSHGILAFQDGYELLTSSTRVKPVKTRSGA